MIAPTGLELLRCSVSCTPDSEPPELHLDGREEVRLGTLSILPAQGHFLLRLKILTVLRKADSGHARWRVRVSMNVLVEMNSVIDWKRRMRAGVTALMNMLVLVGDKTITNTDMLGVSRESADCESNESTRTPVQPLKQSPLGFVFGPRSIKRGRGPPHIHQAAVIC
jgi:hypothetical protein